MFVPLNERLAKAKKAILTDNSTLQDFATLIEFAITSYELDVQLAMANALLSLKRQLNSFHNKTDDDDIPVSTAKPRTVVLMNGDRIDV
jgi:hypothetical protein